MTHSGHPGELPLLAWHGWQSDFRLLYLVDKLTG